MTKQIRTLTENIQTIHFTPIIETKYRWFDELKPKWEWSPLPIIKPRAIAGWDVEEDSRRYGWLGWEDGRKTTDNLIDTNHFRIDNKWFLKAKVVVIYLEGTTRLTHTEYFIDNEIAEDYIKEIEDASGCNMVSLI